MCTNYESQLQAAQKLEARLKQELETANRVIERLKDDLQKEQQFRVDIDVRITKSMEETQTQVSDLYKRLAESEKHLHDTQTSNVKSRHAMDEILVKFFDA